MNSTRSYTMRARAQAAANTRDRILAAGRDLLVERAAEPITLDDIAVRAGVSVPTVLRAFGSKTGALDAAGDLLVREMRELRPAPPAGDITTAVSLVFGQYETWGDYTMRILAAEFTHPELRTATDDGRRWHRNWVATTFRSQLAERNARDREALVDALVVATDVYTWKLLRRDMQLSKAQAEARAVRMITALMKGE